MSSLRREAMSKMLPPKGTPPSSSRPERKLPAGRSFARLPWSDFFDEKTAVQIGSDEFNVYLKGDTGPVYFFLHGGGYCGLTWACLAAELSQRVECRVVAPDLRGHGDTKCVDEDDLSTAKQIEDIAAILHTIFPSSSTQDPIQVIVVGHSMGGALAVHVVAQKLQEDKGFSIGGLVVIDVVEGTAMEALAGMTVFLRSRPSYFDSEEAAIRWCLSSGTVRNSMAARVSMPAQVRQREDGKPHWTGWFRGLSCSFLACHPPKMLVLAGTDRMDKELMIGQMQGKFQTTLLPRVGHAVQEDSPDRLADELARFAVRYRLATAKGGMKFHPPMC